MYSYTHTYVTSRSELYKLKAQWDELVQETGRYNFQLSFNWINTILEFYHTKNKLRIICFYKREKLIAILPLIKTKKQLLGFIPLVKLTFIGRHRSDWNDIITRDHSDAFLNYIIKTLRKQLVAETLLLNLPDTSIFNKHTNAEKASKCYYVDTTSEWEDYLNTIASSRFVKRDIKRLTNRYKDYSWQIKQSDFKDLNADLKIISVLHANSQQKKNRTSNYLNLTHRNYIFNLVLNIGIEHCRLYYLIINNEPASFILSFYFQNTLYYWNVGYKTSFGKLSPSKYLLYHVMKSCFDNPDIDEFNFMLGETNYKTKWAKMYRTNIKLRVPSKWNVLGKKKFN